MQLPDIKFHGCLPLLISHTVLLWYYFRPFASEEVDSQRVPALPMSTTEGIRMGPCQPSMQLIHARHLNLDAILGHIRIWHHVFEK